MSLIFGSTAIKHHFPDYEKEPDDLDIIGKGTNKKGVEYHWTDSFEYIVGNNKDNEYVDSNFLYTIKCSHASWDINWDKHMHDIVFLKDKGCVVDETLYKMLYKDWELLHGKKHVYFSKTNDEFFNKNVKREFDHDWLHEFVSFYDEPLHNAIRKRVDSPKCSRKLFEALSHSDRIKCALEEVYVIAIERFVLNGVRSPKHAKYLSLKKLITSMTKGWFNLFLIDNFKELIYSEHDEYFKAKVDEILCLRKQLNSI